MKKQITFYGWRIELSWQGLTIKRAEPADRYREIKMEAWMQAADAFIPAGLLLTPVAVPVKAKSRRVATSRSMGRRRA